MARSLEGQALSTGLALYNRVHALLLQRTDKHIDLRLAEAALTAWRAIRLQMAHIRPAPDSTERDTKRLGSLRSGEAQRT
jgi:hypothetical protein